jgi:hypothetical protein
MRIGLGSVLLDVAIEPRTPTGVERAGLRSGAVVREIAAAAARFLTLAGVAVFVTYFSFAVPYAFTRGVTAGAFWTDFLPLEIAAVAFLAVLTAAGVWFSFSGGRVQHYLEEGRVAALIWPLAVVGLAVGTFAGATGVLYEEGALELRGERVTESGIVSAAGDFYLWHIVDAVPLLDITETLRWEAPYEYGDTVSGALLLGFEGFVLLPLISAGRVILSGRPHRGAVHAAARRAFPGSRIVRPRGLSMYDWAVLEIDDDRLLVDTQREIQTAEGALAGLRRIGSLAGVGTLSGYVLVADAVAADARREIEAAFAHSSLPSALAVWHKDQPDTALADQLTALRRRRITRSGEEPAAAAVD